MIEPRTIIVAAAALGGVGVWLLLPRGNRPGRRFGAALSMIALGLIGSQVSRLGNWLGDGTFGVLAAVTVIAAAGAISCRSPVYCAIWFALSLMGTAGLFLFAGAQFLGVATIVVYAGAILVTFLFVLMLAQPGGHAFYDRVSWQGVLSAAVGAVLVGLLTTTVIDTFGDGLGDKRPTAKYTTAELATEKLAAGDPPILSEDHVARLGEELFSRHLIAVEVAGTLLLIALVGTIAIIAHGKPQQGKPAQKKPKLSPADTGSIGHGHVSAAGGKS